MNRGDWEHISDSLSDIVQDELYAPTAEGIRTIPEVYPFAKRVVKQSVREWLRESENSYLLEENGDEIHIVRPNDTNLYIGPEGSACTVEIEFNLGDEGIDFVDAIRIGNSYAGTAGISDVLAVARGTASVSESSFWNQMIFREKYILRQVSDYDFETICDSLTPTLTSISDQKPACASDSIETYAELCDAIYDIASKHYVPGMYPDSSGDIGTTFETLLNIDENNIQESDLQFAELKTQRHGSSARQTLFSKAPPKEHRKLWKHDLVETLGYTDDKGRTALRTTITGETPNSQSLYLECNETQERLEVHHTEYGFCFGWPFSCLERVFESKLNGLVIVKADKQTYDGDQFFWYNTAEYLGEVDSGAFIEQIRNGTIKIDTRMYIQEDGSIRNRGTSFRVNNIRDLEHLYSTHRSILSKDRAKELITETDEDSVLPAQ